MINNTTVTQSYTTTGLEETIYPVTFRFYSDINGVPKIVVQIKTASATEYTTLQYAGDYTLQDVEAGGQGILLVNEELFVSGSSLRITRTTPLTQDIDFQVGRIDPEQIELSADLSAMRDQEIRALVDAANATADEALEDSAEALETANEAEETAGQAKTIAEGIEAKADEALEDSAEALETANEAKETAEAAEEAVAGKQDQIVAGANITIAADGKTISATDTVYTAGSNITIVDNTISATYTAGNGLTLTGGQFSANVQNVTSSTSTTDALSANMGREMQLEISHLQSIGRFLSFWNCATGLPTTSPQTSPYAYQTGDYFRVGTVATGGATNYKPNGSTYTTGVASTTVETGTVVVGQVYYYDGTNWSLSAGGGTTETDERTVHYNTDNELEVIGVKDQKTGNADKVWTGTLAEYNAIASKDNNTIYNVTDDVVGGVDIYTKAEVNAAFVHKTGTENITGAKKFTGGLDIGNIEIVQGQQGYKDIKGMDTNNNRIGVVRFEHDVNNNRNIQLLVVNSQDVNKGGISVSVESDDTTVHTTAITPAVNSDNRDIVTTEWIRRLLGNHYVTEFQAPTANNNYTWYRKYADGWVEQGSSNPTNSSAISLPVTMLDANYTLVLGAGGRTGSGADISSYINSKTTTGFYVVLDRTTYINWQVSGMAA